MTERFMEEAVVAYLKYLQRSRVTKFTKNTRQGRNMESKKYLNTCEIM